MIPRPMLRLSGLVVLAGMACLTARPALAEESKADAVGNIFLATVLDLSNERNVDISDIKSRLAAMPDIKKVIL